MELAVRMLCFACIGSFFNFAVFAADRDQLLSENPQLRALMAEDPARADAVIDEINRLMEQPISRGLYIPPNDKEIVEVLTHNPAFQEIYRRDRKATAKLLSTLLDN